MHKKAFGASNIGAAYAFSCFGFCFWTDLWMCVFEFEIAIIVLPNTLVLFPEMCTRFGKIPSKTNVVILYSESVN